MSSYKTLLDGPPKNPLVAVSILSADFGFMIDDCKDVLEKGADLLHVDVIDGHFAPNLTMGGDMIKGLRRHLPEVFLDVHLMVTSPGDYVEQFAKAGADLFSFHLEVCSENGGEVDGKELIAKIRDAGMKPGMVINPPTRPEGLERYLELLDLVLVMSVNPGRSGQTFMPEVLEKTAWLKERLGPGTRLEMDGGLNPETAKLAAAAGVDTMVTASALFGKPLEERAGVIEAFHQSAG